MARQSTSTSKQIHPGPAVDLVDGNCVQNSPLRSGRFVGRLLYCSVILSYDEAAAAAETRVGIPVLCSFTENILVDYSSFYRRVYKPR